MIYKELTTDPDDFFEDWFFDYNDEQRAQKIKGDITAMKNGNYAHELPKLVFDSIQMSALANYYADQCAETPGTAYQSATLANAARAAFSTFVKEDASAVMYAHIVSPAVSAAENKAADALEHILSLKNYVFGEGRETLYKTIATLRKGAMR